MKNKSNSFKILMGLCLIIALVLIGTSAIDIVQHGFTAVASGTFVGTTIASGFSLGTISDSEFTDIGLQEGDEDMGGFGCVGYLALRQHISGYPTLPNITTPTDIGDLVTLIGDYTFSGTNHFMKILVPPDTISIDPESQGENIGGKSFKQKGTFMVAGFSKKNAGLARILNNSFGILVIPQEDGSRLAIGSELRPVRFTKVAGKSGLKAADAKGFTYEYETDSHAPFYYYEGEIVLDGETIEFGS